MTTPTLHLIARIAATAAHLVGRDIVLDALECANRMWRLQVEAAGRYAEPDFAW